MPVVAAARPAAIPLAIKPIRVLETRTDGPALNKCLAATGGLLARLQPAGHDRPAALGVIEVIPYALPFKEPYVTARGTLTRREMVLLRIRDEDGVEGLGEAVPLCCAVG